MFKVVDIVVYPIKGMAGISLSSAKVEEKGFEHDRRFMLIDDNGKFLTQREYSSMTQFESQISKDKLIVKYESESLEIDLSLNQGNQIPVKVWKHNFEATHLDQRYDDWFSTRIGDSVKLVKMTDQCFRKKSLVKAPRTTMLSFADGYPYLMLGTASMEFLNSKLESKLDINRFRANIIVETQQAHQEDEWDKISIGEVPFRIIKPCARCQVITIEQETGIVGKEPLKTLASYRKKANNIYFGMNTVSLEEGIISKGDLIQIN